MKLAEDFRWIARDVLRGKWKIAVLVGLVATLLGAVGEVAPEVRVNFDNGHAEASFEYAGQTIFSTNSIDAEMQAFLAGSLVYIIIAGLIMGALYFILSSVISVGYAKFNLKLVDRQDGSFEDLFAYFSHWKTMAAASLLQTIYVVLWSLLLIIPGIIASFRYAMTDYILAENPELSASEAISLSKQMMQGNKWRLFCLGFSFIGWDILCAFTLGIGNLWLTPYRQAATAAFYREVSDTWYKTYDNSWEENDESITY